MKFFARLLIIVLAVAGATAFTQLQTQRLYQKQDAKALSVADDIQTARARIGGTALDIEIADTDAERAQGLSEREALAESAGMFFVFETPGFYNFWMPNMRFPIDIIWIDEHFRVIGFAENVPPLDPGRDAVLYSPPAPIKYALEVVAGFSARHNIAAGQQVDFE